MPRPNWALLTTMTLWGYNFVAVKFVYVAMSPAALGLARFLVTWATLAAIVWGKGGSLKCPQGLGWRIAWQGFLSMGVYMVLFLEGIARVAPGEGAILLATSPILTAIIAALVGQERLVAGTVVGSLTAFAGVGLVVGSGAFSGRTDVVGAGLLLASALVWAVATVISKPIMSKVPAIEMFALSMPAAALVLVPYGVREMVAVPWGQLSPTVWGNLFHVTFLAGLVGFVGFYRGVQRAGASAAMLYQFLVPLLASFFAWVCLGTVMTWVQWLGVLVVLLGVGYASWSRLRAAVVRTAKS